MGTCKYHPDRETSYVCLKHGTYLCEDCLRCGDPDIYCKYRSSCIIHFIGNKNSADIDGAQHHPTDKN